MQAPLGFHKVTFAHSGCDTVCNLLRLFVCLQFCYAVHNHVYRLCDCILGCCIKIYFFCYSQFPRISDTNFPNLPNLPYVPQARSQTFCRGGVRVSLPFPFPFSLSPSFPSPFLPFPSPSFPLPFLPSPSLPLPFPPFP